MMTMAIVECLEVKNTAYKFIPTDHWARHPHFLLQRTRLNKLFGS